MDPSGQPSILKELMQVEEKLIARVNPILQVTHACGGHTSCIPEDISIIARKLPHLVQDLDVLISRTHTSHSKHYDCYVKISQVMNALHYKLQMDKYYRDVVIDMDSVSSFPKASIDVSNML